MLRDFTPPASFSAFNSVWQIFAKSGYAII
jgi:hypothetical protein